MLWFNLADAYIQSNVYLRVDTPQGSSQERTTRVLDLMIEQWWELVCAYLFVALHVQKVIVVVFDCRECWKLYESHWGHKIVNRSLHPSITDRLSESLAPRNVESWIHCSDQIKHSFDGTYAPCTHINTAELCLKALGLSQKQQTSNTSVDWHTPQHNVCSAKQKKTWWHINLNMLPGCAGRMLFLTYLQNPLSDWVECGPWCWLSHWVLAIHKAHLECVKARQSTQLVCGSRP